jgi:hypothetical protein
VSRCSHPVARLGEAAGGFIGAAHAGVGGCGSPGQPRGEGQDPGITGAQGRRCGLAELGLAELKLPELEELERVVGMPAVGQRHPGVPGGVGDPVGVPGLIGQPQGAGEVTGPVYPGVQLAQRGGQLCLDRLGRGYRQPPRVERYRGAEQVALPAVVPRHTAQPLGDRPHGVHVRDTQL